MATNQIANPSGASAEAQATLDSILAVLRERTGCDFSGYRPATIYRRVLNRMISVGAETLGEYLSLLATTEEEGLRLLDRVTIKVSRFYRNRPTFEILRRQLIPALADARGGAPVRVWSAGCGCGEEAYSLAMLLEESGGPGSVEASDIDPTAITAARIGMYPAEAVAELPAELIARYLEPARVGAVAGYRVRDALRRRVRFSLHDLTSARPAPGPGKFDLVCCRNVLIYLQRDLQAQTLRRVARALDTGGHLCLGEAEWPAKAAASFEAIGRKSHIFRKVDDFFSGETK